MTTTTPEQTILDRHRFLSLRTYRSDGSPVDSPMWFARLGAGYLMRTPVDSPKVQRVLAEPRVELRPSTVRGEPVGDLVVTGRAALLEGREAEDANSVLHRRYGWQYNVVPGLNIPGVPKPRNTRPLRERARLARTRSLWDGYTILCVTPAA